jgi:hypothetical protein
MITIPGYPNTMPKESQKWFPKFLGNNVIINNDHLYVMGRDMENEKVEHEDVALNLLASSLTKDS